MKKQEKDDEPGEFRRRLAATQNYYSMYVTPMLCIGEGLRYTDSENANDIMVDDML
jgi:hypothetical protein